jgi:hypothetical protein
MAVITSERPALGYDGGQAAVSHAHPHRHSLRRRLVSEGGITFFSVAALYLTCGSILAFHYHAFLGDAVSRMANGFYVLYSRDPHLAAIGFVWNPLQSVADMVPLLLYHLWPALATRDMAGIIVSSLCMAGATYQLLAAFREWGVPRAPRLVLVALFALNPMVVFYGANGMSEALYLFTLVAVSRYLARWLRNDGASSLAFAGLALGLCYLARNEAVAPAITAGALVVAVSFYRASGPRKLRFLRGLTDLVVFLFPFVICFVGWAVVSFVITGSAFDQFTSVYGNSAQIQAGAGGPHMGLLSSIDLEGKALLYLAPLLVVSALLAAVTSFRRRDVLVLVPVCVIASGLAFDLVSYVSGGIIWSLRYCIATVALNVVLVGVAMAAPPVRTLRGSLRAQSSSGADPVRMRAEEPSHRRVRIAALAALAFVLLAPALVTTAAGMFNPRVGVEESRVLGYVVHSHRSALDRGYAQSFQKAQDVASYIADLRLPVGDVVVDNSSPCVPLAIVVSPDPRVFVIPNDRDFQRILADPLTFRANYVLLPPTGGQGSLTATNRLYPALYSKGDDPNGRTFATLVHTFGGAGACPSFRLYRVTHHPDSP